MGERDDDLKAAVEGGDGILTIRGSGTHRGWNGIRYKTGLSAKNVGSTQLSMNVAQIPPGGVAYAHIHVGFDLMLYILEGNVRHEYGDKCKKMLESTAGFTRRDSPGSLCGSSRNARSCGGRTARTRVRPRTHRAPAARATLG